MVVTSDMFFINLEVFFVLILYTCNLCPLFIQIKSHQTSSNSCHWDFKATVTAWEPEYNFSKWEVWPSKAALSFFNLEATNPQLKPTLLLMLISRSSTKRASHGTPSNILSKESQSCFSPATYFDQLTHTGLFPRLLMRFYGNPLWLPIMNGRNCYTAHLCPFNCPCLLEIDPVLFYFISNFIHFFL